MAGITTHVLDTSAGTPGRGIGWTLYRLDPERRELAAGRTNDDGRADGPILAADALEAGRYEIVFAVGPYFRDRGIELPEPTFLSDVPVRFGVADPTQHYHVPLLVSPYGYATYRGS